MQPKFEDLDHLFSSSSEDDSVPSMTRENVEKLLERSAPPMTREIVETLPSRPALPKMTDESFDAPVPKVTKKTHVKIESEQATNVIIVGHVDSGKSTLIGRLLFELGDVPDLEKLQRKATLHGKGTFAFAWVMDIGEDERSRGITMDVSYRHFRNPTSGRLFHILDSPGHSDFIPGVVKATSFADCAVLLINAVKVLKGEKKEGMTFEHLQILQTLNIQEIIVAVNKMDEIEFSEESYKIVVSRVRNLVKKEAPNCVTQLRIVPMSAYKGVNVRSKSQEDEMSWYSGPTFLDILEELSVPAIKESKECVFAISACYETSSKTMCEGKVEKGSLALNKKLRLIPHSSEECTITEIECLGQLPDIVKQGSVCTLAVRGGEQYLCPGTILTNKISDFITGMKCKAKVQIFNPRHPLRVGKQMMFYIGAAEGPCAVISVTQPGSRKSLSMKDGGIVELEFEEPTWWRTGIQIILRDEGSTVAGGVIIN